MVDIDYIEKLLVVMRRQGAVFVEVGELKLTLGPAPGTSIEDGGSDPWKSEVQDPLNDPATFRGGLPSWKRT